MKAPLRELLGEETIRLEISLRCLGVLAGGPEVQLVEAGVLPRLPETPELDKAPALGPSLALEEDHEAHGGDALGLDRVPVPR